MYKYLAKTSGIFIIFLFLTHFCCLTEATCETPYDTIIFSEKCYTTTEPVVKPDSHVTTSSDFDESVFTEPSYVEGVRDALSCVAKTTARLDLFNEPKTTVTEILGICLGKLGADEFTE